MSINIDNTDDKQINVGNPTTDEGPESVLNIKLNCLTSVQLHVPDIGHFISRSSISFLTLSRSIFDKY